MCYSGQLTISSAEYSPLHIHQLIKSDKFAQF